MRSVGLNSSRESYDMVQIRIHKDGNVLASAGSSLVPVSWYETNLPLQNPIKDLNANLIISTHISFCTSVQGHSFK